MKRYRVEWDCEIDGIDHEPEDFDLPGEVEVPDEVEDVADWLSANYDFCVVSLYRIK
jgi:hypothetical protein